MASGASRQYLLHVSPFSSVSGCRLAIEPQLLAQPGAIDHPPPLMQHQRLLRRGLGVVLWSRRHQRADLHAADRCGTCLRPGAEGSGETAEPVLVGADS